MSLPPSFNQCRTEFEEISVGMLALNRWTGAVVRVTWKSDPRKGEVTILALEDAETGEQHPANHWSKVAVIYGPIPEASDG